MAIGDIFTMKSNTQRKNSGVNRVPDRRHSHRNIAEPSETLKAVARGENVVGRIGTEDKGPTGKWGRP